MAQEALIGITNLQRLLTMDNRQLRTAMVTKALSSTPMDKMTGSFEDVTSEVFEAAQRVFQWRTSLNLNLSIAVRGSREGSWYIDLIIDPQTGWKELLTNIHNSIELMMCAKKPQKVLFFNPDMWSSQFIQKKLHPEIDVNFVNNNALWNFESFLRDESAVVDGKSWRDIDYGVLLPDEIGNDENTFDFIQIMGHDASENLSVLRGCVDSLVSGGVLLINSTNNAGKLYRDDYWFHPMNEIHEILKSSEGHTFHNSESYGFTAFVKS
jgi:hypothetical protein